MTRYENVPSRTVRLRTRLVGGAVAAVLALAVASPAGAQQLQTESELVGFEEYTSYDNMMTYLQAVQASSTEMRLGTYGETREGRELPYAIFSRPAVTQPWEAWALGKPILVLAAGVHGPERTLRESVLVLLRDFATPGTAMNAALDDLTIVVVPQINPDGFSRPGGPQRGNLWGLDLNRDYMKLEQPEIQGYVQNILLRWQPHLYVDGHNGGAPPYNIAYQCPSHAAPHQPITDLCNERIFPAIDRKLEAEGYSSFFYDVGRTETRWTTGGTDPRIGRNYGGFMNAVGILFESPPARQSRYDAAVSGILAYEAVVEWALENPELLMETVRTARVEAIAQGAAPEGRVPVEVEYAPYPETVTYQLVPRGQGAAEAEVVTVQSDSLMIVPVPTLERDRPWAYVVPRDAESAIELLRRHAIAVERLQEDTEVEVQAYTVSDITYERAYNHAASTRVHVGEVVTRTMTLPRGSYIVRTGQMQGRVVSHMLEAESSDGVVYWNHMDAWLPKPELAEFKAGEGEAPLFPIVKLMAPTPLATRLLP
jgi:dipeptidyl-peptidase 4